MSPRANRPPLWLAAAAMASFWAVVFGGVRLVRIFIDDPYGNDFRVFYSAAKVGLDAGWSHIYDAGLLRAASSTFPVQDRVYDSSHFYVQTPLLAWIVAPMTALPEPAAFVLWTVLGVAVFVIAWAVACPFTGLARITLLLLGLALFSVHESLRFGQPTLLMLALIALAWQQAKRDRPVVAGALLALAVMLKPQDVIFVPLALLVAGRRSVFLAFVGWAAALSVAFVLALGSAGINGFLSATLMVQSDPIHQFDTMAYVFGIGPATYATELLLGALALVVAYLRRAELEMVFALGVLGSVMASPHMHQPDYALNVLAAWLVLRTGPGFAHKLWLVLGVPACQLTAFALPLPQLLWETVWLGLLGREALARRPPELLYGSGMPRRKRNKSEAQPTAKPQTSDQAPGEEVVQVNDQYTGGGPAPSAKPSEHDQHSTGG
ncbi:MAG TPA: glycosyltransferase family 87 protein [Candidatus Dormibacteraeota bacterium]|nr:glycosyltransferase family 87 protein [Candidatus Dormibacteraeota bacterium]